MSSERTNRLHLPSLSIAGFRGIDRLSIRKLGRATLLVGNNGVGKTTVLDAVRVYASRGAPGVLAELLEEREEFAGGLDEHRGPAAAPDFAALFHGWAAAREAPIAIGPIGGRDALRIEVAAPGDGLPERDDLVRDRPAGGNMQALKVVFHETEQVLPGLLAVNGQHSGWSLHDCRKPLQRTWSTGGEWTAIACENLDFGLPESILSAGIRDNGARAGAEELAVQALGLILEDRVERVAVVGGDRRGPHGHGRRVVAKLRDLPRPVPLRSLGGGAAHLFAAGLALAGSAGGFLLIDEAENGLYHRIQQDFWRLILRVAHENNVQVLATTQSSDCVIGFAAAVAASDGVEGALARIERNDDGMRAVEYTKHDIEATARNYVEVR